MKKERERFEKRFDQEPKKSDLSADIINLKQKVGETSEAISKTASHAKDKAGQMINETLHDAKQKSMELGSTVATYVQENPLKVLGFSLLAGALIALLWKRD
jgi:ElaB/YqjD/DUF883 family membrane-anchored ribosome-binding protein